MDRVRKMEVAIGERDGPIKLCGIGYALFNRWLAATVMSDEALLQQFETEMTRLTQLAESFTTESPSS
jgi:hypothetical protein